MVSGVIINSSIGIPFRYLSLTFAELFHGINQNLQIFLIHQSSHLSAKRVNSSIISFIERRMKLKVNREKSRICIPIELNYLGHSFNKDGSIYLSRTSEKRLKQKIRDVIV
jgi:hypothetical protein